MLGHRLGDRRSDDRAHPSRHAIRQIVELEKAEQGMAMPYDAESVIQLRGMLPEARKQKLSAGLRARREKVSDDLWRAEGI